jgi:hypothetical protein
LIMFIYPLSCSTVDKYVEKVLEDMSYDDLYCNFRLNGDVFDFLVTDKSHPFEDHRVHYSDGISETIFE